MNSFKPSIRCLAFGLLVSVVTAGGPQVDLGYARYEGLQDEALGINTFYGIRFAAPPTGSLRWKAPVPIESKNNYTGALLNASSPGPQCWQGTLETELEYAALFSSIDGMAYALGLGSAEGVARINSEDCLLLDVIVPSQPKSSLLPVIIQIHGGGYVAGNTQATDGSPLVNYSNGTVIMVSIQYRLGAYGFLGSDEFLADGDPNIGLLDQYAAFEWVQRNIGAFGGDPTKVTIWGTSAGAGSVLNHLIIGASDSNPPYRAAVAEFPWFQPYHDNQILEAQYQSLLDASGCSNLTCLRELSEDALWAAANETLVLAELSGLKGEGDFYYGPYVDGKVIRDLPSAEFARGNFQKVPLLIDHDAQEGLIFQNLSITAETEVTADLQQLWPSADESFFTQLYSLYPLSGFNDTFFSQPFFNSSLYAIASQYIPSVSTAAGDSPLWQVDTIFGDALVNCPSQNVASSVSAAGQPVWKLYFDAGVYIHGASCVFTLADGAESGNTALADIMKSWYLSFVTDLDPNTAGGPQWPQYGTCNGAVMVVNDDGVAVQSDGDASDQCKFFLEQSNVVRN